MDAHRIVEEGRLAGSFHGFKDSSTVFRFEKGDSWRQVPYKHTFHYAHTPEARVFERGGRYFIEVEGLSDIVEVERD